MKSPYSEVIKKTAMDEGKLKMSEYTAFFIVTLMKKLILLPALGKEHIYSL